MESKAVVQAAIAAAQDKKARDILALEIGKMSPIADYFIILSAGNTAQAQAIADNIEEKLLGLEQALLRKEGYKQANWILLDYGSVVVHIFREEDRRFYNLEQLWGDAPVL